MNNLYRYATPVGRVLIAVLFLMSAVSKIMAYEGMQGYMSSMGVSGSLLPLVIAFELAASVALAIGWQTRLVALLLAGFTMLSAIIFHHDLGDQLQFVMFLKNVAITGGLLGYVGFESAATEAAVEPDTA